MSQKLYAERDIEAQGDHYIKHVGAMTGEGLHSKMAIAAELAHRDIRIDELACMLKVFRGCIKTGLTPTMGSPCYHKLIELIDESDDEGATAE